MGQKSNVNSLRLANNVSLNNTNIKLNFISILLIKYLTFLFKKRGVYIFKTNVGFISNRMFINLHVFFNTQKIVVLKKLSKINKNSQNKLKFSKILKKILTNFRMYLIDVKIVSSNKSLNKSNAIKVFSVYKKYLNNLFDKKFYLCLDITKITTLFLENKISTSIFLLFIGQVFAYTHKKNHTRFFMLISSVFEFLIANSKDNTKIEGLKLDVSGKLLGKAIASSQLVVVGKMPTQTLNKNIEFEKLHVYTVYGAFGFKIYTFRENVYTQKV